MEVQKRPNTLGALRLGMLTPDQAKQYPTQAALAEAMDVDVRSVAGWEAGEYKPNADNFVGLLEAFGCSASELTAALAASRDERRRRQTQKHDADR